MLQFFYSRLSDFDIETVSCRLFLQMAADWNLKKWAKYFKFWCFDCSAHLSIIIFAAAWRNLFDIFIFCVWGKGTNMERQAW